MAVPKKKVSKSRRNMRRSHDALTALNFAKCAQCGAPQLSHSACESCGFYKGRTLAKNILKSNIGKFLRV